MAITNSRDTKPTEGESQSGSVTQEPYVDSSSPTSPFRLMDLPSELFNQILLHSVLDEAGITRRDNRGNLRLTSKALRTEMDSLPLSLTLSQLDRSAKPWMIGSWSETLDIAKNVRLTSCTTDNIPASHFCHRVNLTRPFLEEMQTDQFEQNGSIIMWNPDTYRNSVLQSNHSKRIGQLLHSLGPKVLSFPCDVTTSLAVKAIQDHIWDMIQYDTIIITHAGQSRLEIIGSPLHCKISRGHPSFLYSTRYRHETSTADGELAHKLKAIVDGTDKEQDLWNGEALQEGKKNFCDYYFGKKKRLEDIQFPGGDLWRRPGLA